MAHSLPPSLPISSHIVDRTLRKWGKKRQLDGILERFFFYVDKMNYGILIKITMLQYKPILDIFVQYFDVTFSFFFMKPLRRIMMTNLNISMEENFSRVLLLWMACVTFFSIKKTWDQIWNHKLIFSNTLC